MESVDQVVGQIVPMPQRQASKPAGSPVDLPEIKLPSGNVGATQPDSPKTLDAGTAAQTNKLSVTEIAALLDKINLRLDLFEVSARFSIDEGTGGIQIEIMNNRTGEVLRRIPPYEAVVILSNMGKETGFLVDQKA